MSQNIRDFIRYEPDTGEFFWRQRRAQMIAGSRAGHWQEFKRGRLYRVIRFDGRLYLAHRVAWFIQKGAWPSVEIDHRDCNPLNNRWSNLRLATRCQNARNIPKRTDNTSGFKGVSFDKFTNRWVARIKEPDGPYRNLGRYDTKELAAEAYGNAARQFFSDFARTS